MDPVFSQTLRAPARAIFRGALIVAALSSPAFPDQARAQLGDAQAQAEPPPRPLDEPPFPQVSGQPPSGPEQGTGPAAQTETPPAEPAAPEPPLAAEEPVPPEPSMLELDLQSTKEDLQGLRTDLENFKFQWQRERDLHTAITTRFLTIGGVVQGRFGWQSNRVNDATTKGRKSSFDINSAILSFQGSLYRDYEEGRHLTYNLRFGVSKQTNTNNSFLNLLDAQIIYNFLPTINPEDSRLSATLGQQLLPFGLEVSATEELRPVVRNAQFTTALNLTRREVGLILRGELFPLVDYGYNYRVPVLSYALGVVNGNGPNVLDNNEFKDVIGRLAFTVPTDFNSWLRQFTVGGTVYWGHANETLKDMAKTLVGVGHSRRYGLDVYYNHWPFGVTYEYIYADDRVANGTTTAAPMRTNLHRDSHTATFFLSFGEQFVTGFRNQGRFDDWWPKTYQPFLRFDRFDNDKKTGKNHTDIYTGGFNLFLAETTKFQFNYNLINTTANKKPITHEVLIQAQFGF